jgi:hypothetical protein
MPSYFESANKVGYDKAALLYLASISGELKNITNTTKESKALI